MTTVTGATGNSQQEYMRNTGNTELGKDAFLSLLIAQLRYQDPLNPKDNGEFLAQMAQFTSLEQMQNMNTGLEMMVKNQAAQHSALMEQMGTLNKNLEDLLIISQFSHFMSIDQELMLLGKEVTMLTGDGEEVTGKVTSVQFDPEGNRLVVNDRTFLLSQLVRVNIGGDVSE